MPYSLSVQLRTWSALLLTVSLVACSSTPSEPQASQTSAPSTLPAAPSASHPLPSADRDPLVTVHENPPATVKESAPPASASPSEQPPDNSSPSVEAATVQPEEIPDDSTTPAASFQKKSPSLAHLVLGQSDKEVVRRYGPPVEAYPLPGDDQAVEIWEYDGFSVGMNDKDSIVYVEISAEGIDTGIRGLSYGMQGSQAAELLGLSPDELTNALSVEVAGGWLKIDLDPDNQKVLSFKLLKGDL